MKIAAVRSRGRYWLSELLPPVFTIVAEFSRLYQLFYPVAAIADAVSFNVVP